MKKYKITFETDNIFATMEEICFLEADNIELNILSRTTVFKDIDNKVIGVFNTDDIKSIIAEQDSNLI